METQKTDKYSRKRKKKLLNSIREQIEFYFSDANLRRDKFMRQLVNANDNQIKGTQFVEIEQFLKFNKISEMTDSLRDISLAIESSKSLKLDETKLKVKRTQPFVDNRENSDESTIYVERLPPNADQQWIRSIFKTYGRIEYVKVPRFKHNNNIMGFAFVEFDCPSAAQKACQHFGANVAEVEPKSDLVDNSGSVDNSDSVETDPKTDPKTDNQSLGKRTLETSDDESVSKKKPKLSVENQSESELEVSEKTETNNEVEKSCDKKKKKRRRKRKTTSMNSVEENEVEVINLRVMSKKEWKSWKNKFLKLQKNTMSSIKRSLLINSDNPNKEQQKVESNAVTTESLDQAFEPGLILKLKFIVSSNGFDEAEFKRKIRLLADNHDIAYIDLPNNQIEFKDDQMVSRVCYVRCKSSLITNQLLANEKLKQIGELNVLSGDEESNYWNKINDERTKKKSNNNNSGNKRKNVRGFDKLISRAEKVVTGISTIHTKPNKHIKYDN